MGQYINGEELLIANPQEMPPRVADAILAINADAKFTIINDNVDRLEWLENFTPISKEDIMIKYNELKTVWDNK
jgi:hypothetical protein|tara:strand:- start:340 stop:561 length:222 start_codon:yes stop_codon:yes gene_type:complete